MARASDSFSEIDLTSFHEIPSIQDAYETPIQNIAYKNNQCGRRFYITGLWGPSAAWLSDTGNLPSVMLQQQFLQPALRVAFHLNVNEEDCGWKQNGFNGISSKVPLINSVAAS